MFLMISYAMCHVHVIKTGAERVVQYRRHDTRGQSKLSSGLWHLIKGTGKFSSLSCW